MYNCGFLTETVKYWHEQFLGQNYLRAERIRLSELRNCNIDVMNIL